MKVRITSEKRVWTPIRLLVHYGRGTIRVSEIGSGREVLLGMAAGGRPQLLRHTPEETGHAPIPLTLHAGGDSQQKPDSVFGAHLRLQPTVARYCPSHILRLYYPYAI